ncbi:MAG: DJ-1/PfpI family protein, partial [Thermomicrobiales bacterium]
HLYRVSAIAERPGPVRCRGGLLVVPNCTLDDHPLFDIIVIPGGYGTRAERSNPVVLDWIRRQHAAGVLTTSVCTGAFLLAANGLLDGQRATTHWSTIDWLRAEHPAIDVRDDERIVDLGQIVTSAGVSAGIDMALHIVGRLHGAETARRVARDMEYDGVIG